MVIGIIEDDKLLRKALDCGMELAAAAAINKINVKFFMTLFFCKNNSIPKLFTIEFLPHKFVRDTKGKHRKKQDMQREP